jgi:hypothetical protein
MSTPSLAGRADTPRPTDTAPQPDVLVISVRADEQGARAAARWAEQIGGAGAAASNDATLEARVDAARRVLVIDPGMMAARRGFGVRGTSRERLALVARLAGRTDRVTWASTGAQASEWVQAA